MTADGSESTEEVSRSVKWLVDNELRTAEDAEMTLAEACERYSGAGGDMVPRSKFKWHLIQALPESVDRDGNTFHGVEVIPFGDR